MYDLIIVGAGPAGLAVAAAAHSKGFKAVLLEKGCIANSIFHYPLQMRFFSRASRMSLAGIPFITSGGYPDRREALKYYQAIARQLSADILLRHRVTEVMGAENAFLVKADIQDQGQVQIRGKKIIFATGAFDTPRKLFIPGEELPKVSHYFSESFSYEGARVVVVGGGDSAAEAVLELIENNAMVTLVHRKKEFTRLRPWTQAALLHAIEQKRLVWHGGSLLREIRQDQVVIWVKEKGDQTVSNDRVLLLTGYMPDLDLLKRSGITVDDGEMVPAFFSENLESNVSGMYLVGTVRTGTELARAGIETFGEQADLVIRDILAKM
jgi:putative YpdA family bacillithiol system oxidoreductase